MYIIMCGIDHQYRFNAWEMVLGVGAWDDPERWDGEGGGRAVQVGEHMHTHGLIMSMYGKKPLQYCEVISLQLK